MRNHGLNRASITRKEKLATPWKPYRRTIAVGPPAVKPLAGTIRDLVKDMIEAGVTKETARRTVRAKERFYEWAIYEAGYRDNSLYPPSSDILIHYLNDIFMGKQSGGAARAQMAFLKKIFISEDWVWPDNGKFKHILKGIDRAAPPSSRRAKRPPVLIGMLEELHTDLDKSSGEDACILAAADTGFYGQIRLGEILSEASYPSNYNATTLPVIHDLSRVDGGRSYLLFMPKTKTEQTGGARCFLGRQDHISDPVSSIDNNIKVNELTPLCPLFLWRDDKGILRTLTRRRFLERCNQVWSARGRQRYTGHSFRIGGTLYYLAAGVKPDLVKEGGRWKSDSFMVYWREVENIAPHHLTNVYARFCTRS